MIIAIHQPNFMPWIGFFAKKCIADEFIYLDDVQFSKGSYTNRCRIGTSNKAHDNQWLTVPLTGGQSFQKISEIEIATPSQWFRTQLKQIQGAYRTAPFFEEIYAWLESMEPGLENLSKLIEVNMFCLNACYALLAWKPGTQRSSNFNLKDVPATKRLVSLVKANNGHIYLSGTGALAYQNDKWFKIEGIRVLRVNIAQWITDQSDLAVFNQHVSKSILDLFMHFGVHEVSAVLERYSNYVLTRSNCTRTN